MSRKEKILKKAAKLFSQYSYHGLSMAKLAKSLKVSKSLLFYHFKNKVTLYKEMLKTAFQNIIDSLKMVSQNSLPAEEKLKKLIFSYSQTLAKEENLIRLWFFETSSQTKAIQSLLKKLRNEIIDQFSQVIKEGIKRKEFKKSNAKRLASSLLSLMDGFLYQRGNKGRIKETIELLLKGLKS